MYFQQFRICDKFNAMLKIWRKCIDNLQSNMVYMKTILNHPKTAAGYSKFSNFQTKKSIFHIFQNVFQSLECVLNVLCCWKFKEHALTAFNPTWFMKKRFKPSKNHNGVSNVFKFPKKTPKNRFFSYFLFVCFQYSRMCCEYIVMLEI